MTVTWAASTLSNGTAVSGYVVKRYDAVTPFALQTILTACTGTVTATTCTENSMPTGQWAYSVTPVFATNWTGAESLKSSAVWVDPTPPTNAISMSLVSGSAVKSGDTVFFRGPVAGSFKLTNAVADSGSGPASSTTSTLTGTSTGWTHSPSTVSTPAPGPYVSTSFSWTAGTTSAPTEVVTGRDLVGNTAATTLSFVNDVTGPTGGSVAASGLVGTGSLYAASTSVSVNFAKGTDPSGVAATGAVLKRATATLTSTGIPDGSCGVYGAYTTVTGGTDPVSPKVDIVTDQACFSYQYVVADALGNTTTYTSGDVKVDLTAPTRPTRTFGAFDNTYWSGTGNTIYYRSNQPSGSFTATASATDTKSGIAGFTFPALGTNWASTPGALGVNTYSWSGAPAVVTAKSITATNNATKVSAASTTFTPTVDNTAPGAGTVSYLNGATASTSVSVTFTTGTDTGSGLAPRLLQSASATLTGGTCGTFTGFSTIATNPATSPYVDTVAMGNCYKYQYDTPDNVGNQRTNTSTNVVKISSDVTGPTGGFVAASGLVGTGSLYATSTSVTLTFDKGTDPSGVATTGNLLKRASAPLTSNGTDDGVCGTYGAYATVTGGTDPVSPKSDTVTTAFCWKYQYIVLDTLGNPTTYTSGEVKVDTTAPVVTRTFDAFTNTYWNGVSARVYYRSNQPSGSFTVTASATDPQSGITGSLTFPDLGTNWTSTLEAPGVNTYSWSGTPAAPGAKSITATNNAAMSGSATFTPTVDITSPGAGTVSYLNGATASTSVSVTFTTGTDAGSGLAPRLLQSASATLTGGTCGTFTGFSTIATNPATSPYVDTVTMGNCYKYQYNTPDNVGNQRTNTSTNVVKVPTYLDFIKGTPGLVSYWRLGESAGTPLADSWGTNTGTYLNTPTLGVTGAIAGDSNTAATLNGSDEYGNVARQISDDFSIEFWYKSTQGIGTGTNWYDGAGLVTSGFAGQSNDFGVGLRSDGKIVAGVGGPSTDTSVVSSAGYSSGAWHHVVFTRTMATGALVLYVDGATAGSAAGSTVSLSDGLAIRFGSQMGANYLSGSLDEIAVYNTVLSAATVIDHYNAAQ